MVSVRYKRAWRSPFHAVGIARSHVSLTLGSRPIAIRSVFINLRAKRESLGLGMRDRKKHRLGRCPVSVEHNQLRMHAIKVRVV